MIRFALVAWTALSVPAGVVVGRACSGIRLQAVPLPARGARWPVVAMAAGTDGSGRPA